MPPTREKPELIVTAAGTAVWPKLTTPETKFRAEGVYEVKIKFSPDDEAALIDRLTTKYDDGYDLMLQAEQKKTPKLKQLKKADLPWKPELDEEGAETGVMLFKMQHAASGISKKTGKPWTWRPGIFDASGASLNGKDDLEISGGSVLKVSFEASPYFVKEYGLSLRLVAVQILDLKSYQSRDAAACGFGKEEGYSATPVAADADTGDGADEEF